MAHSLAGAAAGAFSSGALVPLALASASSSAAASY